MSKQKVIYILTNPSFPDLVKIGYTDDITNRLKSLNGTGLPNPYECYAVYEINHKDLDKQIHNLIDKLNPMVRKRNDREFYFLQKEEAYAILEIIAKVSDTENKLYKTDKYGTKQIKESKEKPIQTKRERFKFSMIGLKPGDKIEYIKDKNLDITIYTDSTVLYNGKVYKLSTLARELNKSETQVQEALYFSYNGKILNDIRLSNE